MKKLILIFIFAINLFAVNILILNSYSPTLKWTEIQSTTLVNILQKNIKHLNLYIEDMNTKKFKPTPYYYEEFLNYLQNKYKTNPFDIVIVTDDNALNFVRMYKLNYLFHKSKVFFEGVNNLSLKDKLDKSTYAGVFEAKNPMSNFNLAKKIDPKLKTIYVVSDTSVSGNKTMRQYKNVFKKIKGVKFVYLHTSNLQEIIDTLKKADEHSILMLLTFGRMKYKGNIIYIDKVPKIISKYYNHPILVHNDVYTNLANTNIVGGDCTDAKQQALLNAKKVIKYLNGISMEKLGFTLEGANRIYLNVKNLKKFDVNAYDLGIKDAIFINKPTSFYELYKTQIYTAVIVLILIIIFLIILAKKNRDLFIYSQEIEKLNSSLEDRIKKAIEENRKKEQMLFQQSKLASMGEMIGAIAHQWRQPLNSLGLHTQLLVDDFLDGNVDEKYIYNYEKKQMNIIQFMSKTIDDFRNFFSKDKEKTEFYLKDPTLEVVQLIEKQLLSNHILLTIDYDDSKILGYKNELKQVILNVINNAKDAILENKIENGQIDIQIKNNIITITDNGGGIPKEIQDRIFEPYFTTKDTKGTGIGLYMSKTIIEDHLKGKLYFEVKDNKTTFIIELKDLK